jgi:hypothetical protein
VIDKYDLIFLGLNVENSNAETAISNIAKILNIKEEPLRKLIDSKQSAIIKSGLPQEIIKKYQQDIQDFGGVCECRYSFNFKDASLEDTYDNITFSCPACFYKEIFSNEADLPKQCPQCGVIPSKYENIEAVKEERKRIDNLKHLYKVCQRQLQELLDKQLKQDQVSALPKFINSRRKLIGAAILVWTFGVGMGIIAQTVFYEMGGLDALLLSTSQSAPNKLFFYEELLGANSTVRHQESNTFQQTANMSWLVGSDIRRRYRPNPDLDYALANTSAQKKGVMTATNAYLVENMFWQDISHNREWNLFLISQVHKQIEAQQPEKALRIAEGINSSRLKLATLGQLVPHHF